MMAKDKASLQKEIVTADANRRRRNVYQKTWRSPVPGHTPTPPALEGGPSLALLAAQVGVAALGTVGKNWFTGKNPTVKATTPLSSEQTQLRWNFGRSYTPTTNPDTLGAKFQVPSLNQI